LVKDMVLTNAIFNDQLAIKIHRDATVLNSEIVEHFQREKLQINELIFVPLIIFARIIRLRDAARVLTQDGFPTEAGIIVLSQFEAKLDLIQAATDIKWAAGWIEHRNTRYSVTQNVTRAISQIFDDEDERKVEKSIFSLLSAMKHGNPLSSELGFQVRMDKGKITICTGALDDDMTGVANAMIWGYANYQLAWGAQILAATTGKYAALSLEVRKAVLENWRSVSGFGNTFDQFLRSLISDRDGHLDMASAKRQ
jgi:hypothetical protein